MIGNNKNILVKLSGDLYGHPQVYEEINTMSKKADVCVILVSEQNTAKG
ncbi:MAG: hypothetical protein V1836_02620 [Candidatus Aenigmatarchaeota archaeon]